MKNKKLTVNPIVAIKQIKVFLCILSITRPNMRHSIIPIARGIDYGIIRNNTMM